MSAHVPLRFHKATQSFCSSSSDPHLATAAYSISPKWPLPSLAGVLTFYPDSEHRTSVDPRAAARLSHVPSNGKREKKTGACTSCKTLIPMDGQRYVSSSIWDYLWGFGGFVFTFFFHLCLPRNASWNTCKWNLESQIKMLTGYERKKKWICSFPVY